MTSLSDRESTAELDFRPFSASSCSERTCVTEIRQETVSGKPYETSIYEWSLRKGQESS
jgi:hypothetical protein